jgi:hypothetical protein
MGSAYKIITPVSVEPITLAQAKSYLRIDFDDENTDITALISRARAYVESITGRALAIQQIREIYTIERPIGGELSGGMTPGPNWYQYQEQLGSNPFGAAQFYFDLDVPPILVDNDHPIVITTRVTVFDAWENFTGIYTIDDTQEPARIYFQIPVTANQWAFTFWAGYRSNYPIPPDILQCVYETISHFYSYREAQDVPGNLLNKILARRVSWV